VTSSPSAPAPDPASADSAAGPAGTRTPRGGAAALSFGDGGDPTLVVDIPDVRPAVIGAVRLLIETAIVPTILLLTLMHTEGLAVALESTLGWLLLTVVARLVSRRRMPGTLFVCVGMMSGRAVVALATSSAVIYVIQPVVGSICMALLFLGSVLVGRPITQRLARDFVVIPAHVLGRRGVQRMFTQVSLLWGVSRLADVGMSLALLHLGVRTGIVSRGFFSPILSLLTVAISIVWGMRALRRDGVRLRLGRRESVAPAPTAV
jgi:hypothetical protein